MEDDREKPKVLAIVGPTASGKTALSLALAAKLNCEIVACDSRTVYRYFDIGTAKPTASERAQVPHHLLDVAEPTDNYTVAQFVDAASRAIFEITNRGAMALVCGGTGFYSRALLEGLSIPAVAPQEDLRNDLIEFAQKEGNLALHNRLRDLDPTTADRLSVNDRFRVIRAIEVSTVLGEPFSQVARKVDPPFETVWIGLTSTDRGYLYDQARLRFRQQVNEGLVEETEMLYRRYGAHQKLLHTVNYKQLVQYIEGQIDREGAFEEAIRHNCQLARRQLIWFRANEKINWFDIDRLSRTQLVECALQAVRDKFPL